MGNGASSALHGKRRQPSREGNPACTDVVGDAGARTDVVGGAVRKADQPTAACYQYVFVPHLRVPRPRRILTIIQEQLPRTA